MSEQGEDFIQKLQATGFFDQVGFLQDSLRTMSEDIAAIGDRATQRLGEVESLAAHVIALEAVLQVMLETHPVDAEAVKAKVAERTREVTDDPNGSPTVQAMAQDIIGS